MLRDESLTAQEGRGKSKEKIYVSFGENCLVDGILQRHHIKSFTTPFSHARSNIEYILQLENDHYKGFLDLDCLQYGLLNGKRVPRLKKYNQIINSYNELHMSGFEFTHHDVIADENMRLKFRERVLELRNSIGRYKVIIFYHHRIHLSTDFERLIEDLNKLKSIYSNSKGDSEIVLFTQKIISNESERKLEFRFVDGIYLFSFHTQNEWTGKNEEIFWAKCDDDLIYQMIEKVKEI